MTMTETKVSDEEIQGLIECLDAGLADDEDILTALRQLQAENKRLLAENERLDNELEEIRINGDY